MAPIARVEDPLLVQMQAHEDRREELECDFFVRWAHIQKGQVEGDCRSFDLVEEASKELGIEITACLIKHVGCNPLIII